MVDERINQNKVETGVGEKNHKRFTMEKREDCAVIGFPGEEFLGHLAPVGGRGVDLATSLQTFLEVRGVNTTGLLVVLGDGCSKMSGYNHGFIRLPTFRLSRVRAIPYAHTPSPIPTCLEIYSLLCH